ncbi:Transmembrane protein [Entamoeba marina]
MNHTTDQTVLISTLSKNGFKVLLIIFYAIILIIMGLTFIMPTPYSGKLLNSTCVTETAYLETNTVILKPNSDTFPSSLSETTVIDEKSDNVKAYCDSDLTCQMHLTTVEASRKYSTVYIVTQIPKFSNLGYEEPYLSVVYTKVKYTTFEMLWRNSFLAVMCCCAMLYLFTLRSYPFLKWSIEQKATCILLLALIIFNNPLYCYEFITANEFLPFVNSLLDSLFLSSILLYVLLIFDALRKPLSQRSIIKFYFPRFLVVLFLEGFVVNLYLSNIDNDDPLLVAMNSTSNIVLAIFSIFALFVYGFWLMFGIVRSLTEAKKLGDVGHRIRAYKAIYLTVYGYLNIYCIILALLYIPIRTKKMDWSNNRKDIVLDELKVTAYDDEDNELIIEELHSNDEEIVIASVTEQLLKNDDEINL